ncbi:MAG: hypothetical protein WBG38_09865, partial [Nodosilinea sp.]
YVGDMSSLGPEVVASNIIWNMTPLFDQMLEDTANGTFADQFYSLGVPEGVVQLEVTSEFEDDISGDAAKTIDETRAKIASGELEVPFVPK